MSKKLLRTIAILSIFPCLGCGAETSKDESTIPSFDSRVKSKAKNMIASVDCSDTDTLLVTVNENVKDAKKSVFSAFDDDAVTDLTASITDYNCKKVYSVDLSGLSYEDINKAVDDLEAKDEVYCVEKDEPFSIAGSTETDDPYYTSSNQWGLNGTYGINAPGAWKINTGSSSVRVGVIDSGIAKHTDLNANLVDGYDFVTNTTQANDDNHIHGTPVAGIIGAVGNNGIGIPGYGFRTSLREVIRSYQGLFVWSASNDTFDVDNYILTNGSFDLSNIISVGAINSDGSRRSTSNYSSKGVKHEMSIH